MARNYEKYSFQLVMCCVTVSNNINMKAPGSEGITNRLLAALELQNQERNINFSAMSGPDEDGGRKGGGGIGV